MGEHEHGARTTKLESTCNDASLPGLKSIQRHTRPPTIDTARQRPPESREGLHRTTAASLPTIDWPPSASRLAVSKEGSSVLGRAGRTGILGCGGRGGCGGTTLVAAATVASSRVLGCAAVPSLFPRAAIRRGESVPPNTTGITHRSHTACAGAPSVARHGPPSVLPRTARCQYVALRASRHVRAGGCGLSSPLRARWTLCRNAQYGTLLNPPRAVVTMLTEHRTHSLARQTTRALLSHGVSGILQAYAASPACTGHPLATVIDNPETPFAVTSLGTSRGLPTQRSSYVHRTFVGPAVPKRSTSSKLKNTCAQFMVFMCTLPALLSHQP